MISVNPAQFIHTDPKFYEDYLSSIGAQSGNAIVSPFNLNTAIVNPTTTDRFVDLATVGPGPSNPRLYTIVSIDAIRTVYIGNLVIKPYISTFVVAGDETVRLLFVNSDTTKSYLVEQRAIAAVDTDLGKNREFAYQSIGFSSIRLTATADFIITLNVSFTGVKITY
jgi:hypothetical protein